MSVPIATPLGVVPIPAMICKDEVNYLVFRYLQEGGFQHSAFTFFVESQLSHFKVDATQIPLGALFGILHNHVAAHLPAFAPPKKARPGTKSAPLNSALEKRRVSEDFKRKQFKLRVERRRRWKKLSTQRREERKTMELVKEFKQGLNMSFLFRKKAAAPRKRMSTPDCPLETCPRKRKYVLPSKRVSFTFAGRLDGMPRVPSESSDITHISKASGRIRSPLGPTK